MPKRQRDIQGLDRQIISMYAKGISTWDISQHIESLHGFEVSAELISKVTDKILSEIQGWQNRALINVYAIMFFDAIYYPVRTEDIVKQPAVYLAIGIDLNGDRDRLSNRPFISSSINPSYFQHPKEFYQRGFLLTKYSYELRGKIRAIVYASGCRYG